MQSSTAASTCVGRHDDDREIDGAGNVGDARIGAHVRRRSRRGRVHRHDRAGEACLRRGCGGSPSRSCRARDWRRRRRSTRGSKNGLIDAVAAAGDRAAARAFESRAVIAQRQRSRGRRRCSRPMRHGKARIAKDVEHPPVVAEDVGVEGLDALLRGQVRRAARAAGCRCRGPAARRRPQRRLRRDRGGPDRGGSRRTPRCVPRSRRPWTTPRGCPAASAPVPSSVHPARRNGSGGSRGRGLPGKARVRRDPRWCSRAGRPSNPSRTTTSVVATSAVMIALPSGARSPTRPGSCPSRRMERRSWSSVMEQTSWRGPERAYARSLPPMVSQRTSRPLSGDDSPGGFSAGTGIFRAAP